MKLRHTLISIPAERVWLDGALAHAPDVRGLAVLLRPAGDDPAESRESGVAATLQQAGFATLVVNLLNAYEQARDPDAHFNVPLMANRLVAVAAWIAPQAPLAALAAGLVASGTASGAAVRAAWKLPEAFAALVFRGGRPDLAGATPLQALAAPLRVVVADDDPELPILQQAYALLSAPRDWQVLAAAGVDFSAPGALDRFSALVIDWLASYLPPPRPADAPPPALAEPEALPPQPSPSA